MRRRIISGVVCLLLSVAMLASACVTSASSSVSTTQNTMTNATSIAPTSSSQTYTPTISKEQAIALASPYIPTDIILQSKITVQLEFNQFSTHVWQVSFEGFSATQDELIATGWEASHYTIFPDYPGALYHFAYFNIDAGTGKLLIKEVNVVPGGPGPETTSVVWLPSEKPIKVLSLYAPTGLQTPGELFMQITVENIGAQAITQLIIGLGISTFRPDFFSFVFEGTVSTPLLPGKTMSASRTLKGASYNDGQYYPVFINGVFSDGTTFGYTQYFQIPKYSSTPP